MRRTTTILAGLLCFFSAAAVIHGQTGSKELGVAIQFEQEARYDDALRQYERIINSTDAAAEIKLEAKVRAGRVYLDEKNDLARAVPLFEEGTKALGFRDIVAMSTVYSGKAMLAKATSKADFDAALSEFDTVIRTYAGSPIVVEALIRGGSVLELQQKYERAIINYQSVVFGFPESALASTAFVRLGYTLARLGRIADALGAYENVQLRYQGQPVAASAKKAATLLYRLFLLKTRSPMIFKPSLLARKSDTFKLDDPSKLAYLNSGDLVVVDKNREYALSPAGQPRPAEGSVPDCTDFHGGAYHIVQKKLTLPNSKSLAPYIRKADKSESFDEIVACGVSQYGDVIISTKGPEGIYRVDAQTGESTLFVSGQKYARKMALDSESNFYLLDPGGVAVSVLDAHGKSLTTITGQMTGIKEFADFTLDAFDNLYLLDKQGKFVIVGGMELGQNLRLTPIHNQEIVESAKPVNNLRAITVSPAGTVYVASKDAVFSFQ